MIFLRSFILCFFLLILSSETMKLPVVMVPVLSNAIFLIVATFSIVSPPLINIPFLAALPIPTITAVGVANPIAQGHDITNTAIALNIDS